MKPLSTKQFADECGCTPDAIRRKIGTEIIPLTEHPVTIDADHYDFIIKTFQNKRRNFNVTYSDQEKKDQAKIWYDNMSKLPDST